MTDWTDLPENDDRRGLAVLQDRLGDKLAWLVRRAASEPGLEDWEREADLALELESEWDDYLDSLRAERGANGLRKLELSSPPNWNRIAVHLLDHHKPDLRFRERKESPPWGWLVRWFGK